MFEFLIRNPLHKLTHFFIDKSKHDEWFEWPLFTKMRFHKPNWFDNIIIIVILISAVVAGLETDLNFITTYHHELHIANILIHYIFVFEILVKLYSYAVTDQSPLEEYKLSNTWWKRTLKYFQNGWNLFDVFIVLIGFVPLLITADESSYEAVLAARTLRIFRSLRTLRVLRIIEMLPQLRTIVDTLLRSLPALWIVLLLMAILYYTYGVIGTFLFSANDPEHFGSLPSTLITLFQIMTGDGWSVFMKTNSDPSVLHPHPVLAPIYFISFVLIGAMVVVNLFVGVIVSELDVTRQELANGDNKKKEKKTIDQLVEEIETHQKQYNDSVDKLLCEIKTR